MDESEAWITWDEIKRNQVDAQAGKQWYRQAHSVDEALRIIDDVAQECREGRIESALAAGMDVGRKKDLTELVFVAGVGVTLWIFRRALFADGLFKFQFNF